MKRLNWKIIITITIFAAFAFGNTAAMSPRDDVLAGKHDAPLDMDGDGKTDWIIARTLYDDPQRQVMWYCAMNDGGIMAPMAWGTNSDVLISGDYDGDRKDDIAVWRSGKQGRFYVINSATMTMTISDLGRAGDSPMVVGDYNGDRRDDVAVYRQGVAPGSPSYWYYKTDPSTHYVGVQFGEFGDTPVAGDYDGDRINDFAVARITNKNSTITYYKLLSTGVYTTERFPFERNAEHTIFVEGDYDGDFKTDLATVTVEVGPYRYLWRYKSSSTGLISGAVWGNMSADDYVVPGDYDGDGRYDFAVWRPAYTSSQSAFYVLTSGTGEIMIKEWGSGSITDYPVASFDKGPPYNQCPWLCRGE